MYVTLCVMIFSEQLGPSVQAASDADYFLKSPRPTEIYSETSII